MAAHTAQENLASAAPCRNQKLPDKVAESRQTDARQQRNHEDSSEAWSRVGQAAEVRNFQRAAPLFQISREKEERPGRDAVRNHLVNSAVCALLAERENSKNDEA